MRCAVIDIGTNSVKLLVGDVQEGVVHPLHEQSQQTRLGKDFYETQILQPEPIEATAKSVARFAATANEWTPSRIRVVATSAARDANNRSELIDAVESASHLRVEVISGEVEADWAFRGVTSDPRLSQAPLLILDIGGGSTEFILGQGRTQDFRESFKLGTVRLIEQTQLSDPPTPADLGGCVRYLREFIRATVRPAIGGLLSKHPKETVRLVGTGGTTSILARMHLNTREFDRERIEAVSLRREWVAERREALWRLPLGERQKIVGLPANRADVILGGVAILASVMEEFAFETMSVSTRGLRFGALLDCVEHYA